MKAMKVLSVIISVASAGLAIAGAVVGGKVQSMEIKEEAAKAVAELTNN